MMKSLIAPPPKMPYPNPVPLSESEEPVIPLPEPIVLHACDPISMKAQGSDFNGDFDISSIDLPDDLFDENGDFDFSIDLPEDFFGFSFDTESSFIPDIPGNLYPNIGSYSGNFCDQGSNEVGSNLNLCSPGSGSGDGEREGHYDSDRPMGVHPQASSRGSGGFVSGSSCSHNAISPYSSNLGFDRKSEDGFDGRSSVPKRKKEKGDSDGDSRSSKYHKPEDKTSSTTVEDEKRKERLMKNRESAQLSRTKKKHYVEELELKVKSMHSTIAELNSWISYIAAENTALRQQISGGGDATYPHKAAPSMPYPWMPYPPYPARAYGSQVPVVPIPKLKPRSLSCSSAKKHESNKYAAKSKVKKVASISFLGILFFIFLFGALVPFVNVNFGRNGGSVSGVSIYGGDRSYEEHMGRVLMVNGQFNGSDISRGHGFSDHEKGGCGGAEFRANLKEQGLVSTMGNASEPVFASLYVLRNEKLVRIDGNLIIDSAVASEIAMASKKNASETISSRETETALTVPGELSSALAVPETRGNRAVLHQWVHGGNPMNYNMCTEVLRFDIAPGAFVPSSQSVPEIAPEHLQSAAHGLKMRNRRTLEGLPLPLTMSEPNKAGEVSRNENFLGNSNKTSSSMVVSVLLDPRDVEPETERTTPLASLSRIFVVVLVDSVKYVTYSCVLPRSGFRFVSTR